jgi:hypothetical protein
MSQSDTEALIRRLIGADRAQTAMILDQAAAVATTTRERQLVSIAAAHLRSHRDQADFLAREHLVDYPDSVFAVWVVEHGRDGNRPASSTHPSSPVRFPPKD